jgi:hypothetical protein
MRAIQSIIIAAFVAIAMTASASAQAATDGYITDYGSGSYSDFLPGYVDTDLVYEDVICLGEPNAFERMCF